MRPTVASRSSSTPGCVPAREWRIDRPPAGWPDPAEVRGPRANTAAGVADAQPVEVLVERLNGIRDDRAERFPDGGLERGP
ncbi:MAG: hypothetical protein R2695_01080 [Acidimicrobiales bacterium]